MANNISFYFTGLEQTHDKMVLVTSTFNHVYAAAIVFSVSMYVSSVCKRAVKALARLRVCASSSESSLRTKLLVSYPNREGILNNETNHLYCYHNASLPQ